jgi:hypothetical protein
MFRRKIYTVVAATFFGLCAVGAFYLTAGGSMNSASRRPAGTSISDFSPEQIAKAEWSVSTQDFENSDPGRGRSYFDYVFSKVVGDKRVYDVPYPFQKVMGRLNEYMGYQGGSDSGYKAVLFPLGRSLQRNAAMNGQESYDLNLFFKFPRLVLGVDKEPRVPFALNLKGRLFLGFHEKSKVIEAISYNDAEGRYEYQIVRDYEPGKTPTVTYGNRQLCLSCHQNQTPIFSQSPWSESNAHPEISGRIESALGQKEYFGAPTSVDLSVPYTLDTLVGQGNYPHALQKMWLSLCQNLDCKQATLRVLTRYLLTGEGVRLPGDAAKIYLANFEASFKTRFPNGMKIPEAKVPNRDPLRDRALSQQEIEKGVGSVPKDLKGDLQDLLRRSTVPGELEPLSTRGPSEIWTSSEPDSRNSNKMISGFADLFTQEDIKALDRWLTKKVSDLNFKDAQSLSSQCQVQQTVQDGGFDLQVVCPVAEDSGMALQSGYFVIRAGKIQKGVMDNLFLYGADPQCDRRVPQTTANRTGGAACPAVLHANVSGAVLGDVLQVQFIDPLTKKSANTPFNRKYVLSTFAQLFATKYDDPDIEGKMSTLVKNFDLNPITEKDILGQIKNPVDGFSHSCSMCHYNFDGVPPAFLGLKQNSIDKVGKCQRIEVCAPRILYRLKMRNCAADRISQFQKNPMPMPQFFNVSHVDIGVWQQKVAPVLTEFAAKLVRPQELAQQLVANGVNAVKAQATVSELLTKSCPNVDSSIYESLPRCDFAKLRSDSNCATLMKAYDSN